MARGRPIIGVDLAERLEGPRVLRRRLCEMSGVAIVSLVKPVLARVLSR